MLVIPDQHQGHLARSAPDVLAAVGRAIKASLARLKDNVGDVSYNIVIHTLPHHHEDEFHWHVHVLPRVQSVGGFEQGTGVPINIVAPEQAAATLIGGLSSRAGGQWRGSRSRPSSPRRRTGCGRSCATSSATSTGWPTPRRSGSRRGAGRDGARPSTARPGSGRSTLVDRMEVTEWRTGRSMGVRHDGLVTGSGRFTLRRVGATRRTRHPVHLERAAAVPVVDGRTGRRGGRRPGDEGGVAAQPAPAAGADRGLSAPVRSRRPRGPPRSRPRGARPPAPRPARRRPGWLRPWPAPWRPGPVAARRGAGARRGPCRRGSRR